MSEQNPDILPEVPDIENPEEEAPVVSPDIKEEEPETPPEGSDDSENSDSENSDNENKDEESEEFEDYTIAEYLQGISPLLTEDALRVVLAKRKLKADTQIYDLEERDLDLAEAEVYYSLSNLPVGGATTKDVDGSWSHSEGGWTVSGENIREWYRKYVSLREKWGEKVLTKSTIKVHARGMRVWRRR